MKKNTAIFIIILVLFTACNKNNVYKEYKNLSDNVQWNRNLVLEFNPVIEDANAVYDIYFELNHHTSYPYRTSILYASIISPSGKETEKKYVLKVKGEDGRNAGKGAGDYWDYREKEESGYKFEEAGEYKFIITHGMPGDVYSYVYRLGMIVEKK